MIEYAVPYFRRGFKFTNLGMSSVELRTSA